MGALVYQVRVADRSPEGVEAPNPLIAIVLIKFLIIFILDFYTL